MSPLSSRRSERLSLAPSLWYLGRGQSAGTGIVFVVTVPLLLIAAVSGSQSAVVVTVVLAGIAQVVLLSATAGAHATESFLRVPQGVLGRTLEEVPLSAIHEVWVDPHPLLLPDIGNLTVQCGTRYFHFPGVRHADAVRAELLARRDRAAYSPGSGA